MKAIDSPVKNIPSTNTNRKPTTISTDVVVKPGKEGLRFGPVVTGQVALGKDGCGY